MASLFTQTCGAMRVLDPGAGVGSLTAALAERLCAGAARPRSVAFICHEIDPLLSGYLRDMLAQVEARCRDAGIASDGRLVEGDFILDGAREPQSAGGCTHAILNPPYRRINAGSEHRRALRRAGVETSNLYAGFMFLVAQRLCKGGEMVAIVPRSFCNGPYFRPFRERFFSMMALRHIHVFERRDRAFREDGVLQEMIILHAVKGAAAGEVAITTSAGADFDTDPATGGCKLLTRRTVPHGAVLRDGDPDRIVHIVSDDTGQGIADRMAHFTAALGDLGIGVSTGPVVDFRLRDWLCAQPEDGTAPLLYAAHFQDGELVWPRTMRKANAVRVSEETRKWLWANSGHYVVTRRFSSREERRRIVASVCPTPALPGDLVGFENHLNVFHAGRRGMTGDLAEGLALFLNSSLVDCWFRQFSGHTQVNAADLRSLRYPDRAVLERLGKEQGARKLSQHDIDGIIEKELPPVAAGSQAG